MPKPSPWRRLGPRVSANIGRSRGQFEDLATLRGTVDRPRVARHPRRVHRLLGDPRETLRPDLNRAEAARHVEPVDEGVKDIAGILARMTHRRGNEPLPL